LNEKLIGLIGRPGEVKPVEGLQYIISRHCSLQPDYIEAYFNRGTAFIKIGWPDDAVDDFNMVIRLKPNYAEAYALRGVAYLLQGKNESGCADERKACTLENCKTLEWAKAKGLCR